MWPVEGKDFTAIVSRSVVVFFPAKPHVMAQLLFLKKFSYKTTVFVSGGVVRFEFDRFSGPAGP